MSTLESRPKKIDKIRNYLLETKHNDSMNEKHKKACKYLNHFELLFILASTATVCVSISAFLH